MAEALEMIIFITELTITRDHLGKFLKKKNAFDDDGILATLLYVRRSLR